MNIEDKEEDEEEEKKDNSNHNNNNDSDNDSGNDNDNNNSNDNDNDNDDEKQFPREGEINANEEAEPGENKLELGKVYFEKDEIDNAIKHLKSYLRAEERKERDDEFHRQNI
ncbi:hypothetical protein RFI_37740, partial [Reticulomyxa filosa]